MKITLFHGVLILFLMVGLQACEKDVTDKIDLNILNQLVIVSYISPQDTLLVVRLQRTQPAMGRQFLENELKVTNATVKLSDGTQDIQLNYNANRNIYEVKCALFPIVAGKTYTLNVTSLNGWKASASSTVPVINNIAISSYHLESKDDGSRGIKNVLKFKWQDAAGIDNYYRSLVYRKAIKPVNSQIPALKQDFSPPLELDQYYSDSQQNGQELSSNDHVFYSQKPDDFPHPYNMHLSLLVTDKNYYLYHRSFLKQGEDEGNPFAEPALLYNNIIGGIGIFASYNLIEEIRQVK